MSEGQPPKNIFEAASQQRPARKKSPPPDQPPKQTEGAVTDSSHPKISDEELQQMFDRMVGIQKEIEEKMSGAYTTMGIPADEFAAQMKKIGGAEWEKMDKERQKLENQVWKALGVHAKAMQASKEAAKESQVRKSKTIGSRRRWISVR